MDLHQLPDRQWEPESIPKLTDGWPEGFYRVRVEDIEAVYTEKEPPRLMFVVQVAALEPTSAAGFMATDRFCLGTNDDPEAEDPETLKGFAGQRLLQFVEACGVKPERSLARSLQHCVGMQAIAKVSANKDGSRTEIKRYYMLGKKVLGPLVTTPQGPARGRNSAPPTHAQLASSGPATSVGGTPVRRVGKPNTIMCRRCNESVPTKDYPLHAKRHETDDQPEAEE